MKERKQKQLNRDDMATIITDMTLGGASKEELIKVIEQSKDVIDAEKNKKVFKLHPKQLLIITAATASVVATGLLIYKIGAKKGLHEGFNTGSEMGRYDILRWMNHVEPSIDHVEMYETYYKNHMDEFHFMPKKLIEKAVKGA